MNDNITDEIKALEDRLFQLNIERSEIISKLSKLRASDNSLPPLLGRYLRQIPPQTPSEKIDFFITLFRCREDVFPKMWENTKTGKRGYSPACGNEWVSGICNKPKTKCSDCRNQSFIPFNEAVAKDHLQGRMTVGTYSITLDNTCSFLAADFDKESWAEDIMAYKQAARELGVDVAIERSQSGNGAHAWIFFQDKIPARIARQLGTVILAIASSINRKINFKSYDRFFPNQDYIPKGGYGNLIALPLQHKKRVAGNSVFIDDSLMAIDNQWAYLASIKALSLDEIDIVLARALPKESSTLLAQYDDYEIEIAEKSLSAIDKKIQSEDFDGNITVRIQDQLYINMEEIPSSLLSALKRTATFANPEFFKLQRMRFSTWKTPRYIFCGDACKNDLILPRGCLDTCKDLANKVGATVNIFDDRPKFKKIKVKFIGTLRNDQKLAIKEMVKNDSGVLVAPPGVGKTVIGCYLVAKRRLPTLILVHRKSLMDQWIERLNEFLNIDPNDIGSYGGTKKKPKGLIDLAMLQTLAKLDSPEEFLSAYGQVIVDECHHIPAFSFESVLKSIPAKYFVGLTATPYRKDGHQAIIHMQCGPIRHEMDDYGAKFLTKEVIIRETDLNLESDIRLEFHEICERIALDEERNLLIISDVINSINEGRTPLILSERKDHLSILSSFLKNELSDINQFVLVGEIGKKKRKEIFKEMQDCIDQQKKFYILSTGSLIGEGFDLPILDTLFLTMPIAFKGKLIQYAGRIHRKYDGKSLAQIYDYFDQSNGMTISMFKKRISTYKKMDYSITGDGTKTNQLVFQRDMFSTL